MKQFLKLNLTSKCTSHEAAVGDQSDTPPENQIDYRIQGKYKFDELGTEKDRVRVPIWIHDTLDDTWKHSLREAVQAINEAAPGLSLSITEDKEGAKVHVLAIDEKRAYTKGNILVQSTPGHVDFVAKICLGKWRDESKKGTSIHELLHVLGFHHEHQHPDSPSHVVCKSAGKQITINSNWLGIKWFDPLSIMLYPCKKTTYVCKEKPEDPVWLLTDQTKKNTKLSELDKVGLSLVYPPCIDDVRYKPRQSRNGMYYCGRPVMIKHTYAGPNYTDVCGPDEGPNCPACRTIKSTKVQMILAGERWQGMTGLVYCGKERTWPPQIAYNGRCGIDDGQACPECHAILNQSVDTWSTSTFY